MSTTPLPPANPRRTPPSPYAPDTHRPVGWGRGVKDPGAGCWKATHPDVERETRDRNRH